MLCRGAWRELEWYLEPWAALTRSKFKALRLEASLPPLCALYYDLGVLQVASLPSKVKVVVLTQLTFLLRCIFVKTLSFATG